MKKYFILTFFSLIILANGCLSQNPQMNPEDKTSTENMNEDKKARCVQFFYANFYEASRLCNTFDETFKDFYIDLATRYLNRTWSYNSESYEPYLGWGMERYRRARYNRKSLKTAEKYFKESINFFREAKKYPIPSQQKDFLELEMATAYYEFGRFYLKKGDINLAEEQFEQAEIILKDLKLNSNSNNKLKSLACSLAIPITN